MIDNNGNCWSADHLRVSLFSADIWVVDSETIYTGVFDEAPESITNKPSANESSSVGMWNGLRLEVKRAFNRIDFLLQEVPSESMPIPLIKDVKSVLPIFSSVVSKWAASQSQSIVRIALGCKAFLPSDSTADSYIKLRDFIKVISVDVNRFKEFKFRVNLPVFSKTYPEICINRLSAWAAIILRSSLVSAENTHFFDEKYYVTCSLDVNTDAERKNAIDGNLIEGFLDELSSIFINILEEGIS